MSRKMIEASPRGTVKITCQGAATLPLEEMIAFQGALKTLSDLQAAKLRGSIEREGFAFPVAIWRDLAGRKKILDGHQRIEVLRRMVLDRWEVPEIPVVFVEAENEKQAKRKLLAAASQFGQVQQDGFASFLVEADLELDDVFGQINFPELDLSAPVDALAIEGPIESLEGVTQDEVPELPKVAVTKPGDVWILGRHRLVCGDSTRREDVQKALRGVAPLLMVTDPPYGVEYNAEWRAKAKGSKASAKERSGKLIGDSRADWSEAWILSGASISYVWHAALFSDVVMASLRKADYDVRQQIIWAKTILTLSRSAYHWKHECCWYAVKKGANANWLADRKQTTLWEIVAPNMPGSKENKTPHPTQKPVLIYATPIRNHCGPDDLIYDPFAGSGTLFVAAEQLERVACGIEIDPKYADVIVERWQNLTGKKAKRA